MMNQTSQKPFDLTAEGRYVIRTDPHCHILPNMDDGSTSFAMSLTMARRAVSLGVKASVATPHACHPASKHCDSVETILEQTAELNERLVNADIPLRVYPGMEVLVSRDVPERYEAGRILTWANQGRYILLELGFTKCSGSAFTVIDYFIDRGIVPIIAHPERYQWLASDDIATKALLERPCFFQINVMSLNGAWGAGPCSNALKLMRLNPNWIVATDAHTPDDRFWNLENAREVLTANRLWVGQGKPHPGAEPPPVPHSKGDLRVAESHQKPGHCQTS